MKITYIWHDCFVIDTENAILVFDFWKDPVSISSQAPRFILDACREKTVYVIVSHHHKDHYTTRIFDWIKYHSDIHYILSKDIAKFSRHILSPESTYNKTKPAPKQVTILKPGEIFTDNLISVEAFGSTDIGNSYMVTVGDKTYFHAGDLNAWVWKDESTPEEIEKSINDFSAILNYISENYPEIDYAMFPVDSRIGRDYYEGAAMLVRKIYVKHFFPMHFGLGETPEEQMKYQTDAARIDKYANPERGEYICLQSPYSSFGSPSHSEKTCEKQG